MFLSSCFPLTSKWKRTLLKVFEIEPLCIFIDVVLSLEFILSKKKIYLIMLLTCLIVVDVQAQQLFERVAQTITPEAIENVKAALANSDIEQKAEAKKKAVPRKAAEQTWEDPTLAEYWPESKLMPHLIFSSDLVWRRIVDSIQFILFMLCGCSSLFSLLSRIAFDMN